MHGDYVASAGVTMTTEMVSKATEIIMEMLKLAIEKERNAKLTSGEKSKGLSGGEVTYHRLKAGGEVTMLPSFAKEDDSGGEVTEPISKDDAADCDDLDSLDIAEDPADTPEIIPEKSNAVTTKEQRRRRLKSPTSNQLEHKSLSSQWNCGIIKEIK